MGFLLLVVVRADDADPFIGSFQTSCCFEVLGLAYPDHETTVIPKRCPGLLGVTHRPAEGTLSNPYRFHTHHMGRFVVID